MQELKIESFYKNEKNTNMESEIVFWDTKTKIITDVYPVLIKQITLEKIKIMNKRLIWLDSSKSIIINAIIENFKNVGKQEIDEKEFLSQWQLNYIDFHISQDKLCPARLYFKNNVDTNTKQLIVDYGGYDYSDSKNPFYVYITNPDERPLGKPQQANRPLLIENFVTNAEVGEVEALTMIWEDFTATIRVDNLSDMPISYINDKLDWLDKGKEKLLMAIRPIDIEQVVDKTGNPVIPSKFISSLKKKLIIYLEKDKSTIVFFSKLDLGEDSFMAIITNSGQVKFSFDNGY